MNFAQLIACVLLTGASQAQDSSSDAPFIEVGAKLLSGIETHSGERDKQWILEVNGGGLVSGDFNGDGRHDLVLIDGSTLARALAGEAGRPPRLFLQDEEGRLPPAPEAWSMAGGRFGMGGTAGDLEGDGDLDLVVTEWGRDRLFLNSGGEGFGEAGQASGLEGDRWGTSAAFFDLEGDGDLDLVVVNYLEFNPDTIQSKDSGACRWKGRPVLCGPEGLQPQFDQLYLNRGDGTLEEHSQAAGFTPRVAAFGLGVATLDADLDGDTDLYITNDSTPNQLWENQGDGTLGDVALRRGAAFDANGKEQAGMGIAVGDLNGDGVEDIFCTNFSGESNALYLAGQRGRFRERAGPSGVGGPSVPLLGWGTAALDVDLDTDLDLVVVNGHVYPEATGAGTDTSYAQPDLFQENAGQGHFTVGPLSDAKPSVSRALTWLDLGSDGALDLVVLDLDSEVRVLSNRTRANKNHWLSVRLVDPQSANYDCLGARVRVETAGVVQVREIRTAAGFQAAQPAQAFFGLGSMTEAMVEVSWPDGTQWRRENVAADQNLSIQRERETER